MHHYMSCIIYETFRVRQRFTQATFVWSTLREDTLCIEATPITRGMTLSYITDWKNNKLLCDF